MYQLTLKAKSQLENATRRARIQKPRIEEICFGMYKVWSSNPLITVPYLTGIEAVQDGGYKVCCNCPTQCFLCKHVVSIFPHYLMREKQEQGQVPASVKDNFICQDCGDLATVWTGKEALCWPCLLHRAEAEAEKEAHQAMIEKDHDDLFGFAPARRERVKEEW
jgi:hypothetical protein